MLGAGAGGERRAVLDSAAGQGPARPVQPWRRGEGRGGRDGCAGSGRAPPVWSVRGRAAPPFRSVLQHQMIVTNRVSRELRRLHCVSAATLLLLVLVFNICTAIIS